MREYLIPIDYEKLSKADKKRICNGMGAKDGFDAPDTFYGLNMTEEGNKHDYGYHIGITRFDKFVADSLFIWNMYAKVEKKSNWFMRKLRERRARIYCKFVVFGGDDSYFLKEKGNKRNEPEFNGWNFWYKSYKYHRKLYVLSHKFLNNKSVNQENYKEVLIDLYYDKEQ